MFEYNGQKRPDFAIVPDETQESVWDYPRPPKIENIDHVIDVWSGEIHIAHSTRALRILETASPPTFYLPPEDIKMARLKSLYDQSVCEWKGTANYWGLTDLPAALPVAWSYPAPNPAFRVIRDWLCFYPGRTECFVDKERVRPQEGDFYGGWVTSKIVGPWKGETGTSHW